MTETTMAGWAAYYFSVINTSCNQFLFQIIITCKKLLNRLIQSAKTLVGVGSD